MAVKPEIFIDFIGCQILTIFCSYYKVKHNDMDFGWGCVLNFQKKANQKVHIN